MIHRLSLRCVTTFTDIPNERLLVFTVGS